MPDMNKDVEIEGVKVALRASPDDRGCWGWEFRSANGLAGRSAKSRCPDCATAWSEAADAAQAALLKVNSAGP